MDETYIKIKGQWKYLYRAVDKEGNSGVPIIQHYESPSCIKAAQIEKTAHEHFASHRKFGIRCEPWRVEDGGE